MDKVAERFIKTKGMASLVNIECTLHKVVNTVKGVIQYPLLKFVPKGKIISNLKEQGVIEVCNFKSISKYSLYEQWPKDTKRKNRPQL